MVNQPAPASVSLEIAEKLNQAKEEVVEEEEEVEVEDPSEAVSDGEGVGLDHDSNQSIHLSGEDIALDDDCDGEREEEEEEKAENGEEGVQVGAKSDTAAKITSLLSELASQCESREVIQSRWLRNSFLKSGAYPVWVLKETWYRVAVIKVLKERQWEKIGSISIDSLGRPVFFWFSKPSSVICSKPTKSS